MPIVSILPQHRSGARVGVWRSLTRGIPCQVGFSLLELMMVVGLTGLVTAIAVMQIGNTRESLQGDGGMRVVLSHFNSARQLAISQRRYMRVSLTSPNLVEVIREDTTGTTTTLYSASLEGGVQFMLVTGLPDTPDAFGNSSAVDFGAVTNVKFAPDGTLVNQDGQTTNGSVFLAMPNMPLSARAVTVLGSTGRVRGYRWTGAVWKVV